MSGVLDGVVVLDLTDGIAGAVTTMLLADHGAQVTKIEPPGGDPTRRFSGAQVWHRGKRSAVLDLTDDRRSRRASSRSHRTPTSSSRTSPPARPPTSASTTTAARTREPAARVLLDHRVRRRRRARRPPRDRRARRRAHRPPVGEPRRARRHARPPRRRSRRRSPTSSSPTTAGCGAPRPGPLFSGVPWVSMAVVLPGHARDQRRARGCASRPVAASGCRRRCSRACSPPRSRRGSASSTSRPPTSRAGSVDPRAPKGVFRCADGRWIHQWVPLPDFVLSAAEGDRVAAHRETTSASRRDSPASAWTSTRCCCCTTTNR